MKNQKILERLFEKMLLIREFEYAALGLYSANKIKGSIHVYIGQEAVASGICQNLNIEMGDCITSTHRGHGHLIAMGGDTDSMMAELMGKETGICRGRSGSMHIADVSKGVYGANGIVGAGIPIATGLAFNSAYRKEDSVAVTFFGDGAANQGVLYESMNIASVWGLPVIFVCENNLYAQTTPSKDTTSGKDIKTRAESFGIDSEKIDGMDVEEVFYRSKEIIKRVRKNNYPFFIEAMTYRFKGHWQGDPEVYRNSKEVNKWIKDSCPIERLRKILISNDDHMIERVNNIEKRVKGQIEQSIDFAMNSNYPKEQTLMEYIYEDGGE